MDTKSEGRTMNDEPIAEAMKSSLDLKLRNRKTQRTLIWADDANQWEVYKFDGRPLWFYKGADIVKAIAALNESEPK